MSKSAKDIVEKALGAPRSAEVHSATADRSAMPSCRGHARQSAPRGYSRMFPTAAMQPSAAAIDSLAEAFNAFPGNGLPDKGHEIPAGYTYLGQFIDHDITKMARSQSQAILSGVVADHEFIQLRTPSLDLDSLYGKCWQDEEAGLHQGYFGRPDERPEGMLVDLPRVDREPRIADARNDENFIVARMHVLFMNAHNALMHTITAGNEPAKPHYEEAKTTLTLIYQTVILRDFLPRVLHPGCLPMLEQHSADAWFDPMSDGEFRLPLEFSGAAFRFGHSMARPSYSFKDPETGQSVPALSLAEILELTGAFATPEALSTPRFTWGELFEINSSTPIPALQISPRLAGAMKALPSQHLEGSRNLAFRNLRRGQELRLPSAQTILQFMARTRPEYVVRHGMTALSPESIAKHPMFRDNHILICMGLHQHTPLWAYVLIEPWFNGRVLDGRDSQRRELPEDSKASRDHRLGWLGSMIIAEVFRALLLTSKTSIFDRGERGEASMESIIELAKLAQQGESNGN